tara:strand:+ start:442 stop:675 length:234 start_codon:yes stop_codon:yes gene_type:complete
MVEQEHRIQSLDQMFLTLVEVVELMNLLEVQEDLVVEELVQEEIMVLQEHLEQPTLVVVVVVEMILYKVVAVDQVLW